MTPGKEAASERTPLLDSSRLPQPQNDRDEEAESVFTSSVTKDEQHLNGSTIGERLPYNDYTTIDWLHDLVKDSYRFRYIQSRRGLRYKALALFDACSGWTAVVIIGALTACIAFVVDIAVAIVSDWKLGYCKTNYFLPHERCCMDPKPLLRFNSEVNDDGCEAWHAWSPSYARSFGIYVGLALLFGTISSTATMLTRSSLPSVSPSSEEASTPQIKINEIDQDESIPATPSTSPGGKVMYMAAGSGIPEIKTILSGFTIPSFFSLKVLTVKAFGAIFAVSTGMCLGKEGPFVHISTCIGYLVGKLFPKYRDNGRKMRELLSAACSSGLSVAFGAPIGGVLFSYEEISTYFPRNVLWRAFLCSLTAAMVLKELSPTGTGKLVLFETSYGTDYKPIHYLVFLLLGVAGGIFGGLFCKLNFLWSKWFRAFPLIEQNPVLEVGLVVLATTLLQFPNPLTREPGDIIVKNLLVDCNNAASTHSWVCQHEINSSENTNWQYIGFLIYGTLTKLVLTIITFGIKVPSGVIIPALDAGALFGRLVGQLIPSISPGIFAMVGSAAFLAGVSRMTISLAVIMFELTGQLSYVVPHMLAILTAKCIADTISSSSVYDLAQTLLAHPFLDSDTALSIVRKQNLTVAVLIPPKRTINEITVHVPASNKVPYGVLKEKLHQLRARGLMDAGLVLVQTHPPSSIPMLQGYISQSELEFGLTKLVPSSFPWDLQVRVLGSQVEISEGAAPESLEVDLTPFVDRTPLTICAKAPLEYAVEMFAKLGLRYLMVTEEGTGRMMGVIIKKRLVGFLEHLREYGGEGE